jgi:hypothetical protein
MKRIDVAGVLTHDELERRATSLVKSATEAGLVLRAVGGVGIRMDLRHTRTRYDLIRAVPRDIDLLSDRRATGAIKGVFTALGYEPDERLIAWRGDRRHMYYALDATGKVLFHVDVFIGAPPTCHKVDLRGRLFRHPLTLDPTDLLLLKLQIVEINEKDLLDAAFLMLEHPMAEGGEGEGLDVSRTARLLADDWGFHRTATANLRKLREIAPRLLEQEDARVLASNTERLATAIAAQPKTLKWKLRAKVGTRMRWYETVEEIKR